MAEKFKQELSKMRIGLASPEDILSWSHGEVTKPETINYRSQKPEMDGLFCERIFGPVKDYECHCGRYKRIKYNGQTCDKCGVEITTKDIRRERMGHINLAVPCAHIWYLKGVPSKMATALEIPVKQLEEIVYYNAHVVLNPGNKKISNRLSYKQYISEKNGRSEFKLVLQDILDYYATKDNTAEVDPVVAAAEKSVDIYADFGKNFESPSELADSDRIIIEDLISVLDSQNQYFDYYHIVPILTKYLGAEFGEGAGAVKELLCHLSRPHNPEDPNGKTNLDCEIETLEKELKKSMLKDKGEIKQEALKTVKRLEVLAAFKTSGNKPEWMILENIPVIPPDLRPMLPLDGGRFATSDLNDLYKRIITRNNRLKKLKEQNSPKIMINNECRMVQEAVDALIDNGRRNGKPVTGAGQRPLKSLSEILKGKQGRFRQNLLGKRVDYSGRSVIVIGPELRIYQCGIPREMAIKLLRPYIAYELMSSGVVFGHTNADKMINRKDPEVFDALEKIIDKHPVLLNRAPTLHRLGIQAFQPKLVDGRAIRLHPLVCAGFNADFDGDQMAVHVPLSKSAQEEAINLMLASNNILGPKDGRPIVTPSQDIVIGNYYLTTEGDKKFFLDKAAKLDADNDYQEAEKYRGFAAAEGKVFKDVNEILRAYQVGKVHLHNRIAIIGKSLHKTGFTEEMNNSYLITTVGKIIFNLLFPAEFPFINDMGIGTANLKGDMISFFVPRGTNIKEYIENLPLRKSFNKKNLEAIIDQIFKTYGTAKTSAVIDKIKDIGFKYSTQSGVTVALSDIKILENKKDFVAKGDKAVELVNLKYEKGLLTSEERSRLVINVWSDINKELEKAVERQFAQDSHNPLTIMKDSGARGSTSNFLQLVGMRGLMSSSSGKTIEIPVKSCFREGLNVSEFFTGTHGARKGGADTALKTADSGYLTRRLVDVAQDILVREVDCHTDHGTIVKDIIDSSRNKVLVPLEKRLVGRFTLHEVLNPTTGEVLIGGNELITEEKAKEICDAGVKEVEIRSVLGCETKDGVCVHCYGKNLATGKVVELGQAVGIMAAQSIGEPGTQLTMRTFHSGGVAGDDITQGLPRVQELFEARKPKNESSISKIDGVVTSITQGHDNKYTVTVKNDIDTQAIETQPGAKLRVKKDDVVKAGQKISEGSISPKKLIEVADVNAVTKYVIKEVHKVYCSQNITISDKHIEIILRQMLRRLVILDKGDTNMYPGTRVSINEFTRNNREAILNGKQPAIAKPLVLGITKAALETDSFLSAASFQETTKVLTDAAIRGKVDPLHGLKENVIAGKLIPAGRGLEANALPQDELDNFSVLDKMQEVKDNYIEYHDKVR